jgi:DNA-binding MarR family transcriptional regulator
MNGKARTDDGHKTSRTDDTQAAAELAAILRPSLLRLTRTIRNQRVDESVTLTLLAALMTLAKCGPMSPGELAALERVQPPSMTKILVKLEEKGLIARTPHPTDRRQVVVVATDAGRALLAKERHERDAWLSTRLAMIAPAERELLSRVAPLLDQLAAL